jgi:sulfatase maturation enzyme AslB (radical SAM superfamily)
MDGTPFMNQFRLFRDTGKNTYETVVANMERLTEVIGTDRTGIHMVTHPYNIAFLAHGIDHLYSIGVRNFGIGTVEKTLHIDDNYCDRFIAELKCVSDAIVGGKYPGIHVDVLDRLKPKSDTRNYVKNESGKLLVESYGRTTGDITKQNVYSAYEGHSPIGDRIYNIREAVYKYHQHNKSGGKL